LQDVAAAIKTATVDGTDETPIGRIMLNIEKLTEDLADVTAQNKEKVNNVIDGVEELTETLKIAFGEDGRAEFKQAWGNVTQGMEKFDRSLANIEEVTGKIADGEGTIGRLINDEETVNGVNKAIDNLNRVLGGALNLRTTFDYHSELMTERSDIQSFVGLKIQPGLDRYYYLGIVQDPLGVTEETSTTSTTTTTPPGSEVITDTERSRTDRNAIKFTAIFAKNFYNMTLKGGLIQSSGGLGIDYHFYRERLTLSGEMFDFGDPNLRLFATWRPLKGFYLVAGGDSILQREERDFNPFVGGGLTITNDDINIFAAQFFR
jgi:phospholipid/cholesterol/gamma-HCH transport system substrate-binding protein